MSNEYQYPPKAYRNLDFLTCREARTLRILSEYLEPESRFEHYRVEDTIVFFGSARAKAPESGVDDKLAPYYQDARELAHRLTDWSKSLPDAKRRFIVCSGGGPGIMEGANRGASEAKGLSVGLGISLPFEQGVNKYVSRELAFEFHYFFMRKFWLVYLAKALVVFPGGFGTMDELFELLTLVQTKKATSPRPVLLYGEEFWKDIVNWKMLVDWGVIDADDLKLYHVCSSVDDAFDYLTRELSRIHSIQSESAP